MRVLVTRPQPQADEWVQRLREAGLDAVALPLLRILPVDDVAPLRAAWASLAHKRLVMFVSANAVQAFFDARPTGLPWPGATWAGSTGPGTSAALRACGVPSACVLEPAPDTERLDSEALWQQRLQSHAWRGQQALVVRGEGGRDWLADKLRAQGAQVVFLAAYHRAAPVWDTRQQAFVDQARALPQSCCWLFSSSEGVNHLGPLAPGADWSRSLALASHPRIADTARSLGFAQVQVVPPGFDALVQALKRLDTDRVAG